MGKSQGQILKTGRQSQEITELWHQGHRGPSSVGKENYPKVKLGQVPLLVACFYIVSAIGGMKEFATICKKCL